MCTWSLEPYNKKAAWSDKPVFSPGFQEHVASGVKKWSGKKHSGLHSLFGLSPSDYEITNQEIDVSQRGFGCPEVFYAKVKLVYSTDMWGNAEKDKFAKGSTFFPTTMCLNHVSESIVEAWKDYKYSGSNSNKEGYKTTAGQIRRIGVRDTGAVRWAGRVRWLHNNDKYLVWIGGCGTGEPANQVETAFPARWTATQYKFG